MSLHVPGSLLRAAPNRFISDLLLGSLGFGFAVASASFAGYMIVVGPSAASLKPSGQFPIFAKFDRRPGRVPPDAIEAPAAPAPEVAANDKVDYTPTGTIAAKRPESIMPEPAFPSRPASSSSEPASLHDYVVRDVFDGQALIEARDKLILVGPGAKLEGAGKVLSIERLAGNWVVTTSSGVIGATSR